MTTWYFYWHNKLTNDMGSEAFLEYCDVKEYFFDYMIPGTEDCWWVVTDEKFTDHPCKKNCCCESVSDLYFPPSG